jgi:hypothetical protein
MSNMDTTTDTPTALSEDDPRLTPEAIEHRRSHSLVERDEQGRLLPGSQLPNKGRKNGVMVTTLARQHTDAAIKLLADAMADVKAPMAARVTAAQALLDRGWGKAPIQVDVQMRSRFDSFLRDVGISAALIEAIDDGNDAEIGTTDEIDP